MAEITATFPALTFGHRGVQTRDDFVQTQEGGQDTLSGPWATVAALFKTETNAVKVEVNASRDTVVAKEALVSPHYAAIDTIAANNANITAVATNIVPNLAEILQADTNAATASAAATIAAAAANYKGDWVAGYQTTGYSLGMSVSFTDGLNYVSKINNNLISPTTMTNTTEWNWIEAIDPTTKQDTLVSGTNIKSINGGSILGSGDLSIMGGYNGYYVVPSDYATHILTKDSPRIIKPNTLSILQLPDATTLDTGLFCMLYSVSIGTPINASDGTAITFISASSKTYFVYLTDNTTTKGTWIFTNVNDSDSTQGLSKAGNTGNIYATSSLGVQSYPHQVDMGNGRMLTFIRNQTASTGLVTLSDISTNYMLNMPTIDFDNFSSTYITKIVGTIKINNTQCIVVYGTSTGVTDGFYYNVIDITGDNIVVGARQLLTTAYAGSSQLYAVGITKFSDTLYSFGTTPNGTQAGIITMTLSGTTLTYGTHSIFSTVFLDTNIYYSNPVVMLTSTTGVIIFTPAYPINEYYTYSLYFTISGGIATFGEFVKIETSSINPGENGISAVLLASNKIFVAISSSGGVTCRVLTYLNGILTTNLNIASSTSTFASNIIYNSVANAVYISTWNNTTTTMYLLKINLMPDFTLLSSNLSSIFPSGASAITHYYSLLKGVDGTMIISRVLPTTFYLAYYKVGV